MKIINNLNRYKMNKLKSLISYTLYPVLFICLVSCGNTATKPKPIEKSYKIVVGKTTEIKDGSVLDRGYTKYLLAFNDGFTESTSFGLYTCIKVNDTILFEKEEGRWFWDMKPNCK
jgi:hypothetical protein